MNKEKEDICYGGLKGYGKTYCEMIRLQQENKKLHNKIDNVINYIEEHTTDHRYSCRSLVYADELLKILKDSDVDE